MTSRAARTPECFAFSEKLDRLATAINAAYPGFNRNVRIGGANTQGVAAGQTTETKRKNNNHE